MREFNLLIFRKNSFQITLDPLFLLIPPVVILSGFGTKFLVIYLSILLHELGHVLSALIFGRRINSFNVLPIGVTAVIEDGPAEVWKRILIYLSGPLINILLAVLLSILSPYYLYGTDNMRFFISVNIGLAVFNLIPVKPLDGGRILSDALSSRVGLFSASSYIKRLSLILVILLVIAGIVQFIKNTSNFSLLAIGVYILLSLKSEERLVALMNVKNIVYRRSRLLKRGIYPARDLVVIKTVRLGEVIRNLDFDRFHFIYVLDEELKLVKIFTEQEVVDGMLKYNTELTFEEFMKKGL
ncbi:MAG: M50 family metallopeptidase [Clostridiales bacterium]|nr:M50 family metallopeptidase [Eubacteriales bacterium]MDH7566395.1 M50 family metallopeptidase [Clostridiales bacterium]